MSKDYFSLSYFGEAYDKGHLGLNFCIYALIQEGFAINIEAMIILIMKKDRFHQGHRYNFVSLLTRFIGGQSVEEEDLYYRPLLVTYLVDVTQTWCLDISYELVMILPESNSWDKEIIAHMYGL